MAASNMNPANPAFPLYQDLERQQQIADYLRQQSMAPIEAGVGQSGPYQVQSKISPLQGVMKLGEALMARKAQNDLTPKYQQFMQANMAMQRAALGLDDSPQQTSQSPQGTPQAQPQAPQGTPQGAAPQAPPQTQPMGADPRKIEAQATLMTNAGLPPEVVKDFLARNLPKLTGGERPGMPLYDQTGALKGFAPDPSLGVFYTIGPKGEPVPHKMPNADQFAADREREVNTARQTTTPREVPNAQGQPTFIYPNAPGGSSPSPQSGITPRPTALSGGLQTTAGAASQSEGAKSGVEYENELAKNAAGATEVRRSLSELQNLAKQAPPGAANDAKAKLGAFMIAAGADPQNVSNFLKVDVGALQAAQKQTATLAVNSIHSMTSRGTNFDLDTFMRNNPNLNMADPAAFARVTAYMNNKAKQDIDKQRDFKEWKKGQPANEWVSGHTAHWLDKQNQDIDKGLSNSPNPSDLPSLDAIQAEIARRKGQK